MIPGLHAYAWEHQLVAPVDLSHATVGISAEILVGLNSAEIVARLGSSSAAAETESCASARTSNEGVAPKTAANKAPRAASLSPSAKPRSLPKGTKFIVVFDGPSRTVASKLDDGIERRRIVRALYDAHIPFIVAPALAAAQLACMFQQQYVSHVAGTDEVFLWGDVPLVLDVFAEHPHVLWRHSLFSNLRLGEAAFIEIVVGIGQNAIVDMPIPVLEKIGNPIESAVRSAIQYGGPPPPPPPPPTDGSAPLPPTPGISLYRAAQQVCDPAYVASMQRALAFVNRQPVLDVDGSVVLQNKTGQAVPKDLTEVIGCQLSPEVYWYMNRGLLGPELVRGMLWGSFTDYYRVPLSPPELHASFERLQRQISPLRQQAYSLLVAPMHRYFQFKEVVNRTIGGANFVRKAPTEPVLTATATANQSKDFDVAVLVSDAVRHAQKLAGLENVPAAELPETLAKRAIPSSASTPASVLVQSATLALRELVESVVFWFVATGKVPRSIDFAKLVKSLPWA